VNPDEWIEAEDDLMQAIGFLALMSGCKPHAVFDDPDWHSTILFDLKCSNLVFKSIFDVMKLRA